jgi:hypothetical protein
MTETQLVRRLMAEAGVEYTIYETEQLLWVEKELKKLAKLSVKALKSLMDPDDIKSVRVYEAVMKIKRLNRKPKNDTK